MCMGRRGMHGLRGRMRMAQWPQGARTALQQCLCRAATDKHLRTCVHTCTSTIKCAQVAHVSYARASSMCVINSDAHDAMHCAMQPDC